MINVIPFETLGHQDHGWLDARHHFSFAHYYDPLRMGHPPLRVWNDDTIQAGKGFPMHPHQDMEIITYIRKGAITHEDSLGNRGRTEAGNVQVMSAGKGIVHSEYNLEDEDTTLFQIWIETACPGMDPRWEIRPFPDQTNNSFQVLVSGREIHATLDALKIYQDAALLVANASASTSLNHNLGLDRHAYLVVSQGEITLNGLDVHERDGVAISDETSLDIKAITDTEIVLTDLPLF